jgi:hypothetical protein
MMEYALDSGLYRLEGHAPARDPSGYHLLGSQIRIGFAVGVSEVLAESVPGRIAYGETQLRFGAAEGETHKFGFISGGQVADARSFLQFKTYTPKEAAHTGEHPMAFGHASAHVREIVRVAVSGRTTDVLCKGNVVCQM